MPPPFLLPSYHPLPFLSTIFSSLPLDHIPFPPLRGLILFPSTLRISLRFFFSFTRGQLPGIYSTMISRNGPKRSTHDPQTATEKHLVQNNPQMIPKPHPENGWYSISHFHSFAFEIFILRSVFASTFYAEVSQTLIFPVSPFKYLFLLTHFAKK